MVRWMAQGQESNVMDGRGQQRQRICTTEGWSMVKGLGNRSHPAAFVGLEKVRVSLDTLSDLGLFKKKIFLFFS